MKICFIAEAQSLHTQRQINFFIEKGHDVHLISIGTKPEGYGAGLHYYPLSSPNADFRITWLLSIIRWVFQVRRLVKQIGPDVINAQYITVYGYLGVACRHSCVVLTAMGSDVLIDPSRNIFLKVLNKSCVQRADHVICLAAQLKKTLIRWGIKPEKISDILIGVDTEYFTPSKRDTDLRCKFIAEGSHIIISTRNFEPVYDVATLIKAMHGVCRESPDTVLLLAGRGSQEALLREAAGNLRGIKFLGWIPHGELPAYLASADIYISTALSDGASNSLLEAMACGVAPITTDIPANEPWVKSGDNGLRFTPGDYNTLSTQILSLIRDAGLRRQFGQKSRELVRSRAEYATEMGRMEELFLSLAKAKG